MALFLLSLSYQAVTGEKKCESKKPHVMRKTGWLGLCDPGPVETPEGIFLLPDPRWFEELKDKEDMELECRSFFEMEYKGKKEIGIPFNSCAVHQLIPWKRGRHMKRDLRCVLIIGCLLIFISSTLFAADKYVSSKYSMEYHKSTCKKAMKIDPLIMITYKTAKEALDAGKQPCRMCNPPTKDGFWETILQNF